MPDADVEVEGVPVAPLDVRCHDANKDYVVVTWKQPAVEGSSSILGYYIDRLGSPLFLLLCTLFNGEIIIQFHLIYSKTGLIYAVSV